MKKINDMRKITRIIVATIQVLVVISLIIITLLIASGNLHWLAGWLFVTVYLLCSLISTWLLFFKVPDLIDERNIKHADTKKWDRILVLSYQTMYFPVMIISGLDERLDYSEVPIYFSYISLVLMPISFLLMTWAPLVNKHLETYIRIQHDRNHRVCEKGPYRYIRHPAYLGLVLLFMAMPIALGSWYGLIPSVIAIALVIVRTWMEDNILKKELDGYLEYSKRIKYRPIPLIW